MSSIYGLLLAVATHLSVTSSLLVLFVCFTVFSANSKTCYKRREPSHLMTIWSLFVVIIVTGPQQNCKSIPDRKKKPFVSRVQFHLTIIVAHFSEWWGVHNQILLREAGGGGSSAPVSHPFSFMHHCISSRKGTRFGTHAIDKWYPFHIPSLELCISLQWRIQGRGPGGPGPPLFFDQNEARRTEKNFFGDRAPLISGCGWPVPPPLSEGLDPPLLWTVVR